MHLKKENLPRNLMRLSTIVGIVAMAILAYHWYRLGLFSSREALEQYIAASGGLGVILFIFIQIVQVVIPIIPGGVSCLIGVWLFGPFLGWLYNYIGICVGSIIAFLIAKQFGQPLMEKLFNQKLLKKYASWTDGNSAFTKLFAIAIFSPVAPDDFLCYLAGTTKMRLKTFTLIILLGKPASIALYSLCLEAISKLVLAF